MYIIDHVFKTIINPLKEIQSYNPLTKRNTRPGGVKEGMVVGVPNRLHRAGKVESPRNFWTEKMIYAFGGDIHILGPTPAGTIYAGCT